MDCINWLTQRWKTAGVEVGDTLLLHSDVMRTLVLMKRKNFETKLNYILESFMSAIGSSGTLIIPLFNFDFTTGSTFDVNKTPSHMGALTDFIRKYPGVVRTGHAIYSFAVLGKNAKLFDGLDNYSAYGRQSPFGMLRELNGKVAALDLEDDECMTFYHHVEEVAKVPYRFTKEFTALLSFFSCLKS